jgi:hypothetical protein
VTGIAVHHEGVDPPIRRLDRVRACVPGIDWSTAAGRSDPGERCDFRRNDGGARHRSRSSRRRSILGSTIGFWIGDRYGYPLLLRYGSYIGLTETRIKIAQYVFRRQGMAVVLIARFVAVLRSVVGFIAGANRMPFANFMIANSAGAVAWALFYGLGAYYLGKGVEEFARPFAMALAVIGAIVVISMILYWRRKEQELAAAAERDIPGPLQADKRTNSPMIGPL